MLQAHKHCSVLLGSNCMLVEQKVQTYLDGIEHKGNDVLPRPKSVPCAQPGLHALLPGPARKHRCIVL